MRRRLNHTQRNHIIVGLCTILVLMGVGYAAFSSQLKISGTSNVTGNFLVKITSITPTDIVGNAKDKSEVTTYTDTTATFGTSLELPGDSITYNIVIENQGNIDAILKTINKTDAASSSILFEILGINEGDVLLSHETATMKVKVTYNPNVTSHPDNLESTLNMTLDYAQAGTEVVPGTNNILLGGISVPLVNSGDGLYADEYEAGRYIYRGTNPDNYIKFNDEIWRIIAKEPDGTYKIISNDVLENKAFDIKGDLHGSNEWSRPADLNVYLNNEYYNTLDLLIKDFIVSHNFSIGSVKWNNNDLISQIKSENEKLWKGKIGLISSSDYIRANSNKELCGNISLQYNNKTECKNTNWLFNNKTWWTISPMAENLYNVIDIYEDGESSRTYAAGIYGVRPTLYLSFSITLTGNGTLSNPYVIN